MNSKGLILIILSLSVIGMVACAGSTAKPQGQALEGKSPESSPVFVIGQIRYLESEGGYYIWGDHPYASIFRIANQDPEVLEKLLKTGSKHVNIEGRLTSGTNLLFIEKIWGQPYQGK
jgi:hypothetical protein